MISDIFAQNGLHVSRETAEKLERYHALLQQWQKTVNLVGPGTLADAAHRHFLDSAQIFPHIPKMEARLADLGSGAGFPGMVLAILGMTDVHLIESDVRKATFLREVSRETNTPVTIHDKRIASCVTEKAVEKIDIFTARALSQLPSLLGHVQKLGTPKHPYLCFFLKGAQYKDDIKTARAQYDFDMNIIQSITSDSGKILKISNIEKR